jgi:glycosyltransferase involved in cell wall biosynthesis
MEAMAAERPVVAYNTGGVSEMVVEAETGFMVKPGDIDGLADRITQLAGDADLRRRFAAAAGRRARREFSFDRYVTSMERIFTAAAAGRHRGRGGVG